MVHRAICLYNKAMELQSGDARLFIDPVDGSLRELGLRGFHLPLLEGDSGLFDIALPLPDELPHRLRTPLGQRISGVEQRGDEWHLRFNSLRSERGRFEVSAVLRIRPYPGGGFGLRLHVVNHTPYVIPQILFPHLAGLTATGEPKHEELHLGRSVKQPYVWMQTPDGAAAFYDLYRRWYFIYGMQEWCMKWFRLGNSHRGVSVFSDDLGAPLQGLYVEREKKAAKLTISWAHYPHIETGDSWVSPEIVVQPQAGDWRVGIEQYKAYASAHLPTAKPTHYLRDSLGARSLYFSTYLYDNEPNFLYRDLPVAARDAKAHGLKELICWFLFDSYFELPMTLNPKLGTESELKEAIAECREMGVNIVPFVSCRSLKTRTAPAGWFETDEHGNRRTQAWSYSLNFVPTFNPPYCNRDESAFICPATPEYQHAFRTGCAALHELGFSSICFDQLFADRLCYAKGHHHRPQDLLMPLYALGRQVLRDGQKIDPQASFSGEFYNDVSQTFQHYNWDWITGSNSLDDLEPFRFVFPHFRLGLLVDRSRRWLLEGFTRGLFLNFLPEGGEGLIDADAEFSNLVLRLAEARRRFSRFFEEGEYLGTNRVPGGQEIAALYRNETEWLLIVANPTEREVRIEPRAYHRVLSEKDFMLVPPYEFRLFHWTDDRPTAVNLSLA